MGFYSLLAKSPCVSEFFFAYARNIRVADMIHENFRLATSRLFKSTFKYYLLPEIVRSNYKMIKKKNLRALNVTRCLQDMQCICIDFIVSFLFI